MPDELSSISSLSEEEEKEFGALYSSSSSGEEEEESDVQPIASANFSKLELKSDHEDRPLWVTPEGVIYLERRSKYYKQAYEFLATVGEPLLRSEFFHEWKLTKNSLHSASSVELTPNAILEELEKLSKVPVAQALKSFVRKCADSYGKVKIVLVKGRLFVESSRRDLLRSLLRNDKIKAARLQVADQQHSTALEVQQHNVAFEQVFEQAAANKEDADARVLDLGDEDDSEDNAAQQQDQRWRFEIDPKLAESVKNAALGMDLPLMEEFDYKQDLSTPSIAASLHPTTQIRPYQAKCLSKMFSKSLARSGLFVLPCGSGKTLSAIAAVCTMKKSAIIICSNTIAVEQFKTQFHQFSNVPTNQVCRFTSKNKDELPTAQLGCVLLTTYSMLAIKRQTSSAEALDKALDREWGICILDEVHVAPAKLFRRILTRVKAHCKLGLTATMVREDALIQDLSFLIGPKLYEADWQSLTEEGYLARVLCQEVRCAFTAEFMAEYLRAVGTGGKPQLANQLVVLNPNKYLACEQLILHHEARGDKILVFCDNILAIEYYASTLHREVIHGGTPEKKRMELLSTFRFSSAVNTIFISQVGDMAIDLPEANVIVQISSHFGSRRQEAQRLGRILRPKPHAGDAFNAHFYNLVVPDSLEQFYSNKRKRYLVDQGYAFRVVEAGALKLARGGNSSNTVKTSGTLDTVSAQRMLLAKLLIASDQGTAAAATAAAVEAPGATTTTTTAPLPKARRIDRNNIASISSAAGATVYSEYARKS